MLQLGVNCSTHGYLEFCATERQNSDGYPMFLGVNLLMVRTLIFSDASFTRKFNMAA